MNPGSYYPWKGISIHAPRGGSDNNPSRVSLRSLEFQSTLPVGGATAYYIRLFSASVPFQSTLPVGGATGLPITPKAAHPDFNPRSPWGERLKSRLFIQLAVLISIHAPRGGSDVKIRAILFFDW